MANPSIGPELGCFVFDACFLLSLFLVTLLFVCFLPLPNPNSLWHHLFPLCSEKTAHGAGRFAINMVTLHPMKIYVTTCISAVPSDPTLQLRLAFPSSFLFCFMDFTHLPVSTPMWAHTKTVPVLTPSQWRQHAPPQGLGQVLDPMLGWQLVLFVFCSYSSLMRARAGPDTSGPTSLPSPGYSSPPLKCDWILSLKYLHLPEVQTEYHCWPLVPDTQQLFRQKLCKQTWVDFLFSGMGSPTRSRGVIPGECVSYSIKSKAVK